MGEEEYTKEEPNTISEESDDEAEEEDCKAIENEANKEGTIVDEPRKYEEDKENILEIDKGMIEEKRSNQSTSK